MERISSAIARMLKEPQLRVVDFIRKSHFEGSDGEYIDLYLVIKNTGGDQANDCIVRARAKSVSKAFYHVSHVPFSLVAGNTKNIHFQRIIKSEQKTQALSEDSPTLDRGRIYDCEITFFGANFKDEKKHRLTLDLTSWENIGIILDC